MNDVTTSEKPFTWGTGSDEISVLPSTIPLANMYALALQGFRHKLGNEIAAKRAAFANRQFATQATCSIRTGRNMG